MAARHGLTVALGVVCLLPGSMGNGKDSAGGQRVLQCPGRRPSGAASNSMQRQFWGGQTRLGLEYLNEHVPRSGKVYFHKSSRGCWDLYRKEGLLRQDIQHTADLHNFNRIEDDLRKTTHAVYHHQKSHDDYELAIWRAYGTEHPVYQVAEAGVPLLSIYENPNPPGRLKKREAMKRKLRVTPPPRPGQKVPALQKPSDGLRRAVPPNRDSKSDRVDKEMTP